jgi:hypothetical protein
MVADGTDRLGYGAGGGHPGGYVAGIVITPFSGALVTAGTAVRS